MRADDGFESPQVLARLEAFARDGGSGEEVLPWAARLTPQDQARLRSDLAVVLNEPEATGEPVDWREIGEILQEWAEVAGWDDVLVCGDAASPDGDFAIHLGARDREALAGASPGVQKAMDLLLAEFLPHYPTAWHLLPRGRLKKMRERDTWQLQLPDGYRLRYVVDKAERSVHVVYLGPHPDRDSRGREHSVQVRLRRQRHEDG